MSTSIWWIRRDLRLHDNPALAAALENDSSVVPLFILDPTFEQSEWVGNPRRAFLWAGLQALDSELHDRGSKLVVRHGEPHRVLLEIAAQLETKRVFAERDYSPYSIARDEKLARHVELTLTDGITVIPADTVLKDDGTPYTVFTPFRNRWREVLAETKLSEWDPPAQLNTPQEMSGDKLPVEPVHPTSYFRPGTVEAEARLRRFLGTQLDFSSSPRQSAPVYTYKENRNHPDLEGTSSLSPYLRFGMISIVRACRGALHAMHEAPNSKAAENAATWLDELTWREFYFNILHHFPHVRAGSFRPEYDGIQWRNDPDEFAAWCKGKTGYPFVDAAMRQLLEMGWMHNRSRMVVASFLVKDLLIDWRWGEKWFMQQLIDGDPASNNGGWQWTAGTGTDAAPYFRIFNPVTQSQKFDPEGRFIRRWLPELAHVPDDHIHAPWKMSASIQKKAGCRIGEDYPAPVVDHSKARQRTLEAYQAARESDLKQTTREKANADE